MGTLLDEEVESGIHTFDFNNQPSVWLPEVSVYQEHQPLEPGVYIFVLQTDKRIKEIAKNQKNFSVRLYCD